MESELLNTLALSRIQFAANISFHILFPTITIGLGWLLFYFKLRFEISQHPVWMRIYRFWVKIFALTFAIGVVTGITMSFQFGTNWPGFMEKVGNIAGPLLGYEVMSAFFLEATFLGVMLFGIHRVPSKVHTLATLIVAIGTSLSAFWIIALNSWMHTPAGFVMENGVAMPTDWIAIIFNPSMPYRLGHMMLASFLTASFLIAGVSAYRILKGDLKSAPKLALKQSLPLAAFLIVVQIAVGDMHGINTLKYQPAKIAAMEAVWHTEQGAPLVLFAWPNEDTQRNDYEISIPYGASLILTHELDGEIQGISSFDEDRPAVKPLFFGFRIMVGTGLLMLVVSWIGVWLLWRRDTLPRWMLQTLVGMTFSGWVATIAGWYVTEIGRQPWLVQGVLKTSDAVTTIASHNVALSLAMYLGVYIILMAAYLHTLFNLARKAIVVDEYETGNLTDVALADAASRENRHV
ncbi:cytochrome ubiquinol oxidase subunit I [Oceanospirillaceae bacterium]|nr:cytochrome ubiquinol oxidase subunit I [Oceanospirillaceae bacterium]